MGNICLPREHKGRNAVALRPLVRAQTVAVRLYETCHGAACTAARSCGGRSGQDRPAGPGAGLASDRQVRRGSARGR